MKALNLDKLDAFMEIEYDGEIYNAYTKNDIDDKAINAIPLDKVKEAREEISDWDVNKVMDGCSEPFRLGVGRGLDIASKILDKLIESEDK